MTTAAEQIEKFFQGSATAAKFPDREYGMVIGGEIVDDPRMQQQRDYESGEPITYQDGNPAMQMVIIVQTQLRDPAIGDDDGQRAFYAKGQLRQAIGEALKKVGATSPKRGGKLWVKYVEDKPTTLKNGRKGNDQKIYAAKYEPPAAAAAGQFFDEPAQQPAAQTTTAMPAASFELACPQGVEPAKWAAMTSQQRGQMYAALGITIPDTRPFTEEAPF